LALSGKQAQGRAIDATHSAGCEGWKGEQGKTKPLSSCLPWCLPYSLPTNFLSLVSLPLPFSVLTHASMGTVRVQVISHWARRRLAGGARMVQVPAGRLVAGLAGRGDTKAGSIACETTKGASYREQRFFA